MPVSTPAPNGSERVVGIDELFFSTTDRRGVIRAANAVFERISRYSVEELVGAPHNIVRHPATPAGLFALVWERLLAGMPVAAYIDNLAKDGSHYWTFATIAPLDDGFVSVRCATLRHDLRDGVESLYRSVVPVEATARAAGAGAAEAARAGRDALVTALAERGFASYTDFMHHVLSEEVGARTAALGGRTAPPPSPAVDGELAHTITELTYATRVVGDGIGVILERLDAYLALATRLEAAATDAETTLASLSTAAQTASEASEQVAADAPVLSRAGSAAVAFALDAQRHLLPLQHRLVSVRGAVLELRYRIALGSLYNDMVSAFVDEVARGEAPAQSLGAVAPLVAHLAESLAQTGAHRDRTDAELHAVAGAIGETDGAMTEFQRMLTTWRQLVVRYRVSAELSPYLAPVDAQVSAGKRQLVALRDLADECRQLAAPVDVTAVRAAVGRLAELGASVRV